MEGERGYEVALGYCGQRKLRVEFSERYNRRRHEDETLEESIERTWALRKAENASLFNGTKFRFAGVETSGEVSTIRLGMTDYRTYIGTHFVANARERFGEECMAQPVGNVVIPVTQDGRTVLLVRSRLTGEGVGGLVFPGGHPEPCMIECVREGDDRVEREVWEGARREVLEELWIGDGDVGTVEEMKFLGLVRRTTDGKVSMVFSVAIELTSGEVVGRFAERNDGVESDRVVVVKVDDMQGLTGTRFAGRRVVEETGGAAALWLEMMEAERG